MNAFSATEKLACVEREIKMRRRVYPRWIEQERMTEAKAKVEIALMEAIADDYRKSAEGERLL